VNYQDPQIAGRGFQLTRHRTSDVPTGVEHADEISFARKVLRAEAPVLVDFYAPWCGPCQKLWPKLDELARETPHARIVKVNIDDNPGLASDYGIRSVPALLVFDQGRVVARHRGLTDKDALRRLLQPSADAVDVGQN
jgi:thioredoxin 1